MTLRELIEHLQSLPEECLDFECLYRLHSDYTELDTEDITVQRSTDPLEYGMPINHHNMPGRYRYFGGESYGLNEKPPAPANVILFPGN